jgi:hypothetical protein
MEFESKRLKVGRRCVGAAYPRIADIPVGARNCEDIRQTQSGRLESRRYDWS